MKSLSKYLALLAAVAGLVTVTARAEDAPKPEAPKRERGGDKDRPERPKLSDEEKAKLKAAHEAAEKDPAVIAAKEALKKAMDAKDRKAAQEARKTLGEATKAAMIKADASLAALFEKYPQLANGMGGRGERGGKPGEGRPERGPKPGKPGDKPDAPKPPAPPAGE